MRASMMRLATSSTISSSALRAAPVALLPPLQLYRRLLRVHRKKLPAELRLLGDEYIKSEFRAHRNVENPIHIVSVPERQPSRFTSRLGLAELTRSQVGFLTEWQLYAQKLEGDAWIGEKLDKSKLEKMSGTSYFFPTGKGDVCCGFINNGLRCDCRPAAGTAL
jgi:hypothetical protein